MRKNLVLVAFGVALGTGIGPTRRVEADWTATGSLSVGRGAHTSTLLQDGTLLVAGGINATTFPVTCEIYNPATGTWQTKGSISAGRYAATATLLTSGKVLIAGGGNSGPAPVVAELYDPATGTWSATGAMLGGKRAEHTAVQLSNGKVLVAGGWNDSSALGSCELYDPASGTWTFTGSLASGRHAHAMVVLQDGRVLVASGQGGGGGGPTLSSCEVYNPSTGLWSPTGSMAGARRGHTATVLANGKVLAAGGDSSPFGTGFVATCEIYDPNTGTWSATGSMATARTTHTATLLPSGKLLAAGGQQGASIFSSCELYIPVTGLWETASTMLKDRTSHTATLLQSGEVLVAGGGSSTGYLTSSELFALPPPPPSLNPGDLIVTDVSASGGKGAVFHVDPVTGIQTVISSGGNFTDPAVVTVTRDGDIFVADPNTFGGAGAVFKIDPSTGAQNLVTSGGLIGSPNGIAIAANGDLFVSDTGPGAALPGKIVRVNPSTGAQTLVSSGGYLNDPQQMEVLADGTLLVVEHTAVLAPGPGNGGILLVDPATGSQVIVSAAGLFEDPVDLAIAANGDILVGEANGFGGQGGIVRVNPTTGAQTALSTGGFFGHPHGIVIEQDGNIVAAAPQTIPGGTGALVRVDPTTGTQSVLSSGGQFVDPIAVAVVPPPPDLTVVAVVDLPQEGGPCDIDPGTGKLYVADGVGGGAVFVVDTATNTVVRTIGTAGFDVRVAVNTVTHRVYDSQQFAGQVLVIDGITDSVLESTPIPGVFQTIGHLAADHLTNRLFVVRNNNDDIAVLDASGLNPHALLGAIPLGFSQPSTLPNIVLSPERQRLYALQPGGSTVKAFDAGTLSQVAAVALPGSGPRAAAVNPVTNRVYVSTDSNESVSVIDAGTSSVLATIATGNVYAMAVNRGANRIYLARFADVAVLDGWTNTIVDTIALSKTGPRCAAFDPSSSRVFVVIESGSPGSVVAIADSAPPINQPPIAHAGLDQTVNEGDLVTLDGAGSGDPNGDALIFAWAQISGPPVALSLVDPAHPTFTAPFVSAGGATLTFQLVVSDGALQSEADVVNVTVKNVNHVPVADAGTPRNVPELSLVSLDGSGSFDPDADEIAYSWEQVVAPGDPVVALSGADTAALSFMTPDVGPAGLTLTFRLTVTDHCLVDAIDRCGLSATNTVDVHVQYVNQCPVAAAGSDVQASEGAVVALDGSQSFDPDGNTLTFGWLAPTGIALNLTDPQRPTLIAPPVPCVGGSFEIALTVDDGFGCRASDTVILNVQNINNPPIANAAANPPQVPEGQQVTLSASGSSDPDGEAIQLLWVQVGEPAVALSDPTSASPTFTAPLLNVGGNPVESLTLTFDLIVTDACGGSAVDAVTVLVTNTPHDPVARAGDNRTVSEGSAVALDGSASSDPDGDALMFIWVQIAATGVALTGTDTAAPTFTAPFVGSGGEILEFALTVADPFGGSSTDTVQITVVNINDPPVCAQAQASVQLLWPPNHKLVPVQVLGVVDPNGNATVTITGVTQDEPTNGLGDGDTSPDAVIQGTTALLRAERSGTGNGRVYKVHFTASDLEGGSCTGVVTVTVPHSKNKAAVDDGQAHDSLQP